MARTLSYSEKSKGWVSFKSFDKENGISLNNSYYTFSGGKMYQHHINETRNEFYEDQFDSSVDVLLNKGPGSIKSFSTLNYEGSQARITPDINNNPDYYDNFPKDGWYVKEMLSNAQEVGALEFWDKEDKWFSQIKGVKTEWLNNGTAGNIDPREFSYQGIGNAETALCPYCPPVITWDCITGTHGSCECQQVNGGYGEFSTEKECLCSTGCCGQPTVTWDCTGGGMCTDPGNGTGQYTTYCDCVLDSECCGEGVAYTYDCQNISPPASFSFGCMDDGITTDPFVIQQRPIGWIGEATNYSAGFNVHDCSCSYVTARTWDCEEGVCNEKFDGSGQYNSFGACDQNCGDPDPDPCDPPQNIGVQLNITDPTILPGSGTSTSTSTNYTLNNPTVGNSLGVRFRYGGMVDGWAEVVENTHTNFPQPWWGSATLVDPLGNTIKGGWAGVRGGMPAQASSGLPNYLSSNQDHTHSYHGHVNASGTNPLTLFFHKDTFQGNSNYPTQYDSTPEWNNLITSLNANGPGSVYIYQNFYHPTQIIPSPWTDPNQAETCYAVQSVSYDSTTETYTVTANWLVGQASFQDSNVFVWSETGPFTTTTTGTSGGPCDNTANDGSVSVSVTNINSTAAIPFTTWTLELYDSTTTGSPSPNNLIYTDPNVYAVGAWSNTYVGLSVTPAGTTAYGIYYAIITDNNGCVYGPFVIRVNCIPEPDPCVNYPGDNGCCEKCKIVGLPTGDPCYNWCQQWGDCCDPDGPPPAWDCLGDCIVNNVITGTYGVDCGCSDHYGPYGLAPTSIGYIAGGQYSSHAQCINLCNSGSSGTNWECVNGDCFDVGIGNGSYNSEADCDASCGVGMEVCLSDNVMEEGHCPSNTWPLSGLPASPGMQGGPINGQCMSQFMETTEGNNITTTSSLGSVTGTMWYNPLNDIPGTSNYGVGSPSNPLDIALTTVHSGTITPNVPMVLFKKLFFTAPEHGFLVTPTYQLNAAALNSGYYTVTETPTVFNVDKILTASSGSVGSYSNIIHCDTQDIIPGMTVDSRSGDPQWSCGWTLGSNACYPGSGFGFADVRVVSVDHVAGTISLSEANVFVSGQSMNFSTFSNLYFITSTSTIGFGQECLCKEFTVSFTGPVGTCTLDHQIDFIQQGHRIETIQI